MAGTGTEQIQVRTVVVAIILDAGAVRLATLGRQHQFQFIVGQDDEFLLAMRCRLQQGVLVNGPGLTGNGAGGIGHGDRMLGRPCGIGRQLLQLFYTIDGVLLRLKGHLFLGLLGSVPAETKQNGCDEDNAGNGILVHGLLLFFLFLLCLTDLAFQFFQLLLGRIDAFLHLLDERFRILGLGEETNVVLVGNDILLESLVLIH